MVVCAYKLYNLSDEDENIVIESGKACVDLRSDSAQLSGVYVKENGKCSSKVIT